MTPYSIEGPEPRLFTSPSSRKRFRCRRAVRSSTSMALAYCPDFALPFVASHCQPFRSESVSNFNTAGFRVLTTASGFLNSVSTRYGSSYSYLGRGSPNSFARFFNDHMPNPRSSAIRILPKT